MHANTDRDSGKLKQRLDEHLLGVALHSRKLAGTLPRLERQLPRLARHKGFTRRVEQPRFRWQDKAYDCAMASPRAGYGAWILRPQPGVDRLR
ncbi:hypothetical protein N5938_22730 [Pseudomonas aeruginosa]|uniref:hypothetical protein n=1 Tax=Pseudomonas aeruginosa TaxID=287 RepID=UPI0021F1B9BC|nr:hypothetical protein [Pseudomonas aeruginosa]UYM59383.1 hypothetical protein N5938_22730 [Pseudomonas aeruginosa]